MNRGFSLVELSIVLVILGLLTGGILAGQSLIRAAEIRSVTTDHQRYAAATHSFRDKYFGLPGDLNNATKFWGAADTDANGEGTDCRDAISTDARTCNGDGDGMIELSAASSTSSNERLRAWQQLANAGLIEGSYIGVDATLVGHGTIQVPGVNTPTSKLREAYPIVAYASGGGNASVFLIPGQTSFTLYALSTSQMPLTPEEAWNLDTKTDDGMPATGRFFGYKGTTAIPCSNRAGLAFDDALDRAATYNLAAGRNKYCYITMRI